MVNKRCQRSLSIIMDNINGLSAAMRKVFDLKAFVPSRDYQISREFYRDLGFRENWCNNEICEMEMENYRFLLQNFFVQELAGNFMMSLLVENLDEWWDFINRIDLSAKYTLQVVKAPAVQPWGVRVLFLSDPSGVLWHLTEQPKSSNEQACHLNNTL
jgi:catechol 2,3-dioxygenase-like lactoylglutathione lyase family enzyme